MNDARPAGASGLLDVRVTRKSFATAKGDRHDVLHDIALVLQPGEVGVLVGPSGCGKTTMLRIIAGIDHDYEGHVHRPAAGRLAMVFQEPRLLPWRSVEENIRLIAPQADEATLAMLLETLGLEHHRTHYPGQLSLGQARRVAIARAFAVDPTLLLLDEPFVSLDAALAARLRDELVLLVARRAVSTLLVTHDLEEAVRLADRVFLLGGRPTTLLAEVPIEGRRNARSDAMVAAAVAQIAPHRQGQA